MKEITELLKQVLSKLDKSESVEVDDEKDNKPDEDVTEDIEVDTSEKVVVEPNKVEATTPVTSANELVEDSLDVRLAAFYTELENVKLAIKIVNDNMKALNNKFTIIETSIDNVEEESKKPLVESFDTLVNRV